MRCTLLVVLVVGWLSVTATACQAVHGLMLVLELGEVG